MGLTSKSTGSAVLRSGKKSKPSAQYTVALIGNPNVGKSTVFNALTGLRQHTGNWTGKTVEHAEGFYLYRKVQYRLIDLPGTYSLSARSPEEQIACEYVCSDVPDAVVVVCDACALERTLLLAVQIARQNAGVIVCVNLMDEAKKRGIQIDLSLLSQRLHVAVVGTVARDKRSLQDLKDAVAKVCANSDSERRSRIDSVTPQDTAEDYRQIEQICHDCIHTDPNRRVLDREAPDRFLMKRWISLPIMALLLFLVFWLTLIGANYPSQWLGDALFTLQGILEQWFTAWHIPDIPKSAILDGVYRTLAWVVSVMLPPMAIFFPLFTLMEDAGLLPRFAFLCEHRFASCHACGKQALTTCMGFGCNAAGVVGCRIIESKRERMIAVLTNAMIPCNGRFPALIAVIGVLWVSTGISVGNELLSALTLTAVIVSAFIASLAASWLLGHTVYSGVPSSYVLEIPPFRRPQIGKVIVRSLLDRTLYVLGRAAAVAAPSGLLIWIIANVHWSDLSLLRRATDFLHPFASIFGLDGATLLAFLLGTPANEIVLPIAFMIYRNSAVLTEPASNAVLAATFLANGWTWKRAVCFLIFSCLHWPCATTLWTIRKETGSLASMALAAMLPTAFGLLLCFLFTALMRILGV